MLLLAMQGAEATPTEDGFVPSLATVLTHLVSLSPAGRGGQITRFHAIKAPDITIKDYLERISKYFGCSNECFVLSLVYIDRIVKLHDEFTVNLLNIHRLLITSVMLAAKFFDDVYYSNAFYARVGGVKTREINILEAHFLSLINYQLFVSPQEYDQYRKNVLAAVNAASPCTNRCLCQSLQRPAPLSTSVGVAACGGTSTSGRSSSSLLASSSSSSSGVTSLSSPSSYSGSSSSTSTTLTSSGAALSSSYSMRAPCTTGAPVIPTTLASPNSPSALQHLHSLSAVPSASLQSPSASQHSLTGPPAAASAVLSLSSNTVAHHRLAAPSHSCCRGAQAHRVF